MAISEFESASDGIQQLGQKLDTALRGLGDVENFLDILSVCSCAFMYHSIYNDFAFMCACKHLDALRV